MNDTPIADAFYQKAKAADVADLGKLVGEAYTTIEKLERDAERYAWIHDHAKAYEWDGMGTWVWELQTPALASENPSEAMFMASVDAAMKEKA